jgi:hypothetical protein
VTFVTSVRGRVPPCREVTGLVIANLGRGIRVTKGERESAKPVSTIDEETDQRPVVRTEVEPNSHACTSTNPPAPRSETSRVSERAQRLLRAHLASGAKRGELIEAAAEAAGIPATSLIKAADVLGVRTQKGQWWLPG